MYGQLQRKQMHLKNILQSFQISTLFQRYQTNVNTNNSFQTLENATSNQNYLIK